MSSDNTKGNCILYSGICIDFNGYGCSPYVASGSNNDEKNTYCNKLKFSSNSVGFCFYVSGNYCELGKCEQILPIGTTIADKTTFCSTIAVDTSTGKKCAYD